MPEYTITQREGCADCGNKWDGDFWSCVDIAEIDYYHPESSEHRPVTKFRAAYDNSGMAVCFHVQDQYVKSVHTKFMEYTYRDSCVEFFIQPAGCQSYVNFETNICGVIHASHLVDWTTTPDDEFVDCRFFTPEQGEMLKAFADYSGTICEEITEPLTWNLALYIPWEIFRQVTGSKRPEIGEKWLANFYKCGDLTSHPHWGSWAKVGELNFHRPEDFAPVIFG